GPFRVSGPGNGAGRGRGTGCAGGRIRHVDERLAGGLLCLRVTAVGDVREALAVDTDADEVEQRTVGGAAHEAVRADLAVMRRSRVRDYLGEGRAGRQRIRRLREVDVPGSL